MAQFTGTPFGDLIVGLDGERDVVRGGPGDDRLFGYRGTAAASGVFLLGSFAEPQVDPFGGGAFDADRLEGGVGDDAL